MRKFSFAIWVLIIMATPLKSQELFTGKVQNLPDYDYAPYHFGFLLSLNQLHFTIDPVDYLYHQSLESNQAEDILPSPDSLRINKIDYKPEYGFTVGIIGNLRISNDMDLRFIPSLVFGERVLRYDVEAFGNDSVYAMEKRIPSTYIDLPLQFKYKSKRYNNVRAYLVGGIKYSIDVISNAKREANGDNSGVDKISTIVKLNRNDFFAELGVGFDYYTPYFKFGTEIKMAYGLTDPLVREGNAYAGSIESLRNKYFQLSFTFE